MRAALLLLLRDWRGKELGLLFAAIILATATITCIQLFSDRIQRSLLNQASTFIAGDATINSSQPFDLAIFEQAQNLNIQTASTTGFRAMLFTANNQSSIVATKAVDTNYPLKGELIVSKQQESTQQESTQNPPTSGTVWLSPRLINQLNININDTVYIGEAELTVKAQLIKEPDNAQSMIGLAPRALLALSDVPKTEAVQVGSRIRYTLSATGSTQNIAQFKTYIASLNNPHYRWQDVRSANRNLGSALNRAENFLMLTGSLGVILCGLAIALAARRYAIRQIPHVAMLKTFGVTPQHINALYIFNFLALGLMGVLPGVLLGYGFHFFIVFALDSLLTITLSAPSITPFIFSGLSGFLIFMGFALPPILKLKGVSPAAALRFDEHNNLAFGNAMWLAGFGMTLLLIYFYSQSLQLSLILLGGLLACMFGVMLCNILIKIGHFFLIKKTTPFKRTSLRLGFANIFRHRITNSLQIFVFSTLLMLLFTLTLVRTQLITQWQQQVPIGTPNHFVFNIFEKNKPAIQALIQDNNITEKHFYPITRGRVTHVNSIPMSEIIQNKTNMGDNYERELNLTWANILGNDNEIIEGSWAVHNKKNRQKNEKVFISIEQEYAKGLGITLNDTLSFSISGENIHAQVSSIRTVKWDSMNPNFYIIFNQPLLEGTAATWLTSFYLPSHQHIFTTELLRLYPTLSVIELDQILEQVQSIIQQITHAIELLLLLVLAAGLLVLYSSIQASLDLRKQESAILKTLGANKTLVKNILLVEFSVLGFIAGLLATLGASLALYFIQTRFMQLSYAPNYTLWVVGPMLGTLLIGSVGWLSTKSVITTPPMKILRSL